MDEKYEKKNKTMESFIQHQTNDATGYRKMNCNSQSARKKIKKRNKWKKRRNTFQIHK